MDVTGRPLASAMRTPVPVAEADVTRAANDLRSALRRQRFAAPPHIVDRLAVVDALVRVLQRDPLVVARTTRILNMVTSAGLRPLTCPPPVICEINLG